MEARSHCWEGLLWPVKMPRGDPLAGRASRAESSRVVAFLSHCSWWGRRASQRRSYVSMWPRWKKGQRDPRMFSSPSSASSSVVKVSIEGQGNARLSSLDESVVLSTTDPSLSGLQALQQDGTTNVGTVRNLLGEKCPLWLIPRFQRISLLPT